MKKILYLFPNAKLAGAEHLTRLLMQNHKRVDFEPQAYFINSGPLIEQFKAQGFKTHQFSGKRPRLKNPLSIAWAVKHIVSILKEEKIDLIHSVMSYGHVFGGLASLASRVPEVWYQHGPTGNLDWIAGRINTRALFVNSKWIEKEERSFHPRTEKLAVIYPGIEELTPSKWADEAKTIRESFGFRPENKVFGLAARISPMKGQLLFLRAAAALIRDYPDTRFLLVGSTYMAADQVYEDELRREIQYLGLENHVRWTGFLSPVYPALSACDVVVNASINPEPFGLTVIEGMMLGKAVIAPREGGPAESITSEKNGLLFEPRNSSSLHSAMRKLAQSESLCESLGWEARTVALARFTIGRMVGVIENEYRKVLELPVTS